MDAVGLVHRELTEKVIGLFYETYNELGFGFLESVYESAFSLRLKATGLKVGLLVNFGPRPHFRRRVL